MILNSLYYYRKRAHLTQREVATKLGVKQFVVSLWEAGKQIPTIDEIDKLAEIYNTTVGNLYDQKFLSSLKDMER